LGDQNGPIKFSEHFEEDGATMYRSACAMELEGIVSKLKNGRYHSDRHSEWTKVTCRKRDTFPIVGYAMKKGKFDGLYLGRMKDGELEYAGKVETGFTDQSAKSVVETLRPLLMRAKKLPKNMGQRPKAQWVRPDVLADVEYRALTGEGKLRHPSFKGLREDLMQAPKRKRMT
jgi:bifunctional non-homologous end joining protein LigD